MKHMFLGCKSLKYLNISNFIINQVTNMIKILFKCLLIEEINISKSFYIKNLNLNFYYLFKYNRLN